MRVQAQRVREREEEREERGRRIEREGGREGERMCRHRVRGLLLCAYHISLGGMLEQIIEQ